MAVEASFVIRCDRCGELLYTEDGDLVRCNTHPGIERAAEADGWTYASDRDEQRVKRSMLCRGCVNRRRAMHAWIKQNQVIDHAE